MYLKKLNECFTRRLIFVYQSKRTLSINTNAFVNGEWVTSASGETFDVSNPVNNNLIAKVPNLQLAQVDSAVKSAHNAFISWSQTTSKERSNFLRLWFNKINENKDDISTILSLESGKPIDEAKGEVAYGNSFIEWYSEEARRCYGEVVPSPVSGKTLFHIKQPIGVTAVITPWNFPVAMITRKVGAALAAGCTCVIKPAEDTPLSAIALAHYAQECGLPPGVINVVTCDRPRTIEVGSLLCKHPLIAGVTFTGSTIVGKKLYELCSSSIKRLSLELGGNAPFIVFKNADLDKAVEGLLVAKFRNAGQTCVSANRVLIESDIFDIFLEKLRKAILSKYFDSPNKMTKRHILSSIINETQMNKVEKVVDDAKQKGAIVHCGGKKADYVGKLFYEPTILSNIKPEMLCYHEEIFGPVVSCFSFVTEEEAIKIANSTRSGLAGYFYSSDVKQIGRVSRQLEVGMVGINEGLVSTAEGAFGGVKESGLGREGSHYGIDEFTQIKYMCIGNM